MRIMLIAFLLFYSLAVWSSVMRSKVVNIKADERDVAAGLCGREFEVLSSKRINRFQKEIKVKCLIEGVDFWYLEE